MDIVLSSRRKRLNIQVPAYGTRRMTEIIRRFGLTENMKRLRKHWKETNLLHDHTNRSKKYVPEAMVVSRSNNLWGTNFTKVHINGCSGGYFTASLDLCSRKIRGQLYSEKAKSNEIIVALDSAPFSTPPDRNVWEPSIWSDKGSQLTSNKYENTRKTLGNNNGTIHLNTPKKDTYIESYVGHFMEYYIYGSERNSFNKFRYCMDIALRDSNSVRPHSILNYLTPYEFEERIATDGFFEKK